MSIDGMTCREQILWAVDRVAPAHSDTFTIQDIIDYLAKNGTRYPAYTIRTEIGSRMCSNAPKHHAVTYKDFVRLRHGIYRRH